MVVITWRTFSKTHVEFLNHAQRHGFGMYVVRGAVPEQKHQSWAREFNEEIEVDYKETSAASKSEASWPAVE